MAPGDQVTRIAHQPFALERTLLAIGALGLLLLASPAVALDPDRTLAQLHHTAWTAEDGAPSQVSALAQTTDGYLWIGSARGLFRFDGVTFERYVPPDSVGLPSHNIYALLATADGGLWISFRPSGLGFLRDGHLTAFVRPEEIPPSQVYGFALDHDGRLWAGTQDGLMLRAGSRWVPIGADWNLTPSRVQTLFVDRDGTLWVTADSGLHSLARGSHSFERSTFRFNWISGMVQELSGRFWLSAESRLTVLSKTGTADPGAAPSRIKTGALLVDRDGCLWMANAAARGLSRVRYPDHFAPDDGSPADHRIEVVLEGEGLSAGAVNVLLEDREGNIWAGTTKGLDRFRHNHFVPLELPDGHQALTLVAGDSGSLWVGSATSRPVLHIDSERVTATDHAQSSSCAYRGADGAIWWGSIGKIVRHQRGEFRRFLQPTLPRREWIWEIFRNGVDGALWVSVGDVGLYSFMDGVWGDRAVPVGLPARGPSASYHAPDGRIWLGYTANRVCVLDGDHVDAYTESDGIRIGRVRVIRGRGPHYWLGGELGLSLFKDGRFRTVASATGEPFGTVSGVVETSDGGLWLNEMRGVIHITADDITRVVADSTYAVNFRRFDEHEGLPGAPQMNWTCSTAIEATDGRLWFATDGGLAWIDPERMTTNELPPPLVIRSVGTEAGTFNVSSDVLLPNDTATLRIDYTALSLSIPERVRFRYRMQGYDDDWIDAGMRRTAFYTHLRPGSYRFQVMASNNDGVWNTTGAVLQLSVAPAFYQTKWFAVCSLSAILGALWLAYHMRVRQIASRLQAIHDERMDERNRIAHELHDTLLQGFLSAAMQLHVAKDAIAPESAARQHVGRVLSLMNDVIADARAAVRGLRQSTDSASEDLEHAFSRIPSELGGDGAIDFRVAVNGRLRPLQSTARDEIYRIGRESLVNALRHSGARTIETEIDYLPHEVRVVVRDDGRGIDPDVLRDGRDGHWGLSGMRERAKRIGGRLTVRSRVGAGTEVELAVPGRIAFAGETPSRLRRAARWLRSHVARGARKEG